jgi:hypothetical protein
MKMLRFAFGHTRMDKIENKNIENKTKVTEMHRKIQEESCVGCEDTEKDNFWSEVEENLTLY